MTSQVRIPTSLVGSYAQPDWLIDRDRLRERFPPRVRATELWRVDPRYLEEAQDDATRLAIADQERAGLDIVTDGEMRRESYSNRFATALEGVDIDNPGTALDRSGHPNPVPRVVGPGRPAPSGAGARPGVPARARRAGRRRSRFRGRSRCPSRPRTTTTASPDELGHGVRGGGPRRDPRPVRGRRRRGPGGRALHAGAARGGARVRPRRPAPRHGRHRRDDRGPHLLRLRRDHPRAAERLLVPARAGRDGGDQISIETAQSGLALDVLDALSSKTIILGVLDLSTDEVETPETVAERIRRAFPHAGPERLIAAPDCGMKYLSRDAAYGKLESLVEGARRAVEDAGATARTSRTRSRRGRRPTAAARRPPARPGVMNGTSRSWAMRSPAVASKRASPRLTSTTRSSPR